MWSLETKSSSVTIRFRMRPSDQELLLKLWPWRRGVCKLVTKFQPVISRRKLLKRSWLAQETGKRLVWDVLHVISREKFLYRPYSGQEATKWPGAIAWTFCCSLQVKKPSCSTQVLMPALQCVAKAEFELWGLYFQAEIKLTAQTHESLNLDHEEYDRAI